MVDSLNRVIRAGSKAFKEWLVIERNGLKGELVSKLEETIKKSIVTDVLAARMTRDEFFEPKYEGCIVRAKVHALKLE